MAQASPRESEEEEIEDNRPPEKLFNFVEPIAEVRSELECDSDISELPLPPMIITPLNPPRVQAIAEYLDMRTDTEYKDLKMFRNRINQVFEELDTLESNKNL